jgi:hypothetical protein
MHRMLVLPDIRLARYPANPKAEYRYRISGRISGKAGYRYRISGRIFGLTATYIFCKIGTGYQFINKL